MIDYHPSNDFLAWYLEKFIEMPNINFYKFLYYIFTNYRN